VLQPVLIPSEATEELELLAWEDVKPSEEPGIQRMQSAQPDAEKGASTPEASKEPSGSPSRGERPETAKPKEKTQAAKAKAKAKAKTRAKAKPQSKPQQGSGPKEVARTGPSPGPPSPPSPPGREQKPHLERAQVHIKMDASAVREQGSRWMLEAAKVSKESVDWVRSREAMVPDTVFVNLRPSPSTEVFAGNLDDGMLFDGEVKLQVYHLAKAVKAIGLPIYHTGVEVYGLEHYYCVNGVESCWPRGYGQGVHKAAVPLGKTKLSNARVEQMIKKIKPKWPGKDYKLLSHNCQTFAVELVSLLLPGVVVPSEYRRFAGAKPQASKPVLARRY